MDSIRSKRELELQTVLSDSQYLSYRHDMDSMEMLARKKVSEFNSKATKIAIRRSTGK